MELFFQRAFRPFFLGGSLFASLSMFVWWLSYQDASYTFSTIPSMFWHAHEMVFGYALATVTGFLLTAVMNWSGFNSASGKKLAVVFGFWLLARTGYLFDWNILWVALFDMAFTLGLFLHFVMPVIKAKQWKQLGLAAKFLLLIVANSVFYAGAIGYIENGLYLGVLAGLFLVLAINLTMMRRLIPFFTEKAFGLPEKLNTKWVDIVAIVGFLALMVLLLIQPQQSWLISLIAFPLVAVHLKRLLFWYHPKIWTVVLIWPLYLSYGFMILGMLLFGFVGLKMLNESIAIHALAAGGIGLLCSSIMARISLGHTNRNVFEPPKLLVWVFIILTITAISRVLMPLLLPEQYSLWMQISQWGWITGFMLLTILYWKILTQPSPIKDIGIRL